MSCLTGRRQVLYFGLPGLLRLFRTLPELRARGAGEVRFGESAWWVAWGWLVASVGVWFGWVDGWLVDWLVWFCCSLTVL